MAFADDWGHDSSGRLYRKDRSRAASGPRRPDGFDQLPAGWHSSNIASEVRRGYILSRIEQGKTDGRNLVRKEMRG